MARRTRNVGDWITEAARAYEKMNEYDFTDARRKQLCADYGHQPAYPSGKNNFCKRCGAEVNTIDYAVMRAPGTPVDGKWYRLSPKFASGSAEIVDDDGTPHPLYLRATDEYERREDGALGRVFEVYTPSQRVAEIKVRI